MSQKDLFDVKPEHIDLDGKIPAKQAGELPLERATQEAKERKFMDEHQTEIPDKIICYVCKKEIKANPLYIGQGNYRHRSKCVPSSKEWQNSEAKKKSKLKRFLKPQKKKARGKKCKTK